MVKSHLKKVPQSTRLNAGGGCNFYLGNDVAFICLQKAGKVFTFLPSRRAQRKVLLQESDQDATKIYQEVNWHTLES